MEWRKKHGSISRKMKELRKIACSRPSQNGLCGRDHGGTSCGREVYCSKWNTCGPGQENKVTQQGLYSNCPFSSRWN